MPEQIIPHPEEQRNLSELRSEFREENQKRIHDQLKIHPVGWGVLGVSELARDRYTTEEWAYQMFLHMDAPVSQDFRLSVAPFHLSAKLEKYANESMQEAIFPEGTEGTVDHDAPACSDVSAMSDDELCDYVDRSIRESERG